MSHYTYFPKRGDFIHFEASPSAGHETAGPHFALVLSPVAYQKKTGMAIVLIGTSKFKSESHPRCGNTKLIPAGLILPPHNNPSGEGILFCDAVRQIDWRARSAAYAGKASAEFVEDALDRLLAVMEDDGG
ncbi:MAG: type II toxin-antitoxin system PemK/MazF family toxin [Phycisphaerae bacterium]